MKLRDVFYDSWGCLRGVWFTVIFCAVFVVVVVAVAYIGREVDRRDCEVYSSMTGRHTEYVFGTCYVDTPNGTIPRGELEMRAITNEGK